MSIDTEKIRRLRIAHKLSYAEAAAKAGWSYSSRANWRAMEAGERPISLARLEEMSRALDCSPKSLLK